jgi:hypothetical protein
MGHADGDKAAGAGNVDVESLRKDFEKLQVSDGALIKLKQTGIDTVTNLWAAVGEDYDAGINNVAEKMGVTDKELVAGLVRSSELAPNSDPNFVQRNWFDALLVVLVVVILAVAVVGLGVGDWVADRF